jgi:hypothetical protein
VKIYSDILTRGDLLAACPTGVAIAVCDTLTSTRIRKHGWIVSLTGSSPSYSQHVGYGHRAATWDEHGLWMEKLYELDANARISWYKDRRDFIKQTSEFQPRGSKAPWLKRMRVHPVSHPVTS